MKSLNDNHNDTMKTTNCILAASAFAILAGCGGKPEFFPAHKASGVNPDTHLVLTFESVPSVGDSGFIRIFDAETGKAVDSLDLSLPAGPTESRTYGPDCDYTKIPYDYSRSFMATNRNTLPGTPSGTCPSFSPVMRRRAIMRMGVSSPMHATVCITRFFCHHRGN